MYFAMRLSPGHLPAATVVASVAREYGELAALVDLSQMTVSQMTANSTDESHQQRAHWRAEQVLNWSAPPVVHNPVDVVAGQSGRHLTDGASRCRSAPGAPRRRPWTASPGSSRHWSTTGLPTSGTSTNRPGRA